MDIIIHPCIILYITRKLMHDMQYIIYIIHACIDIFAELKCGIKKTEIKVKSKNII